MSSFPELRSRLDEALLHGLPPVELHDLITDGYAGALQLDAQRLSVRRRAAELAEAADEPEHAQELRRLWLTHGTVARELEGLRALLRRLEAVRAASAEAL